MRKLVGLAITGLLLLTLAAPASAREFGTIYIDGDAFRTFGNPANVPAGTGTDPLVSFTNFDQAGVAQFGPGTGAHGGRLGAGADRAARAPARRRAHQRRGVRAEEGAAPRADVAAPSTALATKPCGSIPVVCR